MKTSVLRIAVLFSLAFAMHARAEVLLGATLEWLADTCPSVGIYSARKLTNVDGGNGIEISAELAGPLRGEPPRQFAFLYKNEDTMPPETERSPRLGDQFLLFFGSAAPASGTRPTQVISLTRPAIHGHRITALRPDFTILTDGQKIVEVVKERIAKMPVDPGAKRNDVKIPIMTPAYWAVYSKSTCYLIVPDDLLEFARKNQKPGKPPE